jgi:proteasome accessory factor B
LRRRATSTVSGADGSDDVIDVAFASVEQLAEDVAGYGAAAVVIAPDDLRDVVVRRLRAVAKVTTGAAS